MTYLAATMLHIRWAVGSTIKYKSLSRTVACMWWTVVCASSTPSTRRAANLKPCSAAVRRSGRSRQVLLWMWMAHFWWPTRPHPGWSRSPKTCFSPGKWLKTQDVHFLTRRLLPSTSKPGNLLFTIMELKRLSSSN